MTKTILTRNLDMCLALIDDFGWVKFIDDVDEIENAHNEAVRQLGIIEVLFRLHLIDARQYMVYLDGTLSAIQAINEKNVELLQLDNKKVGC